MLDGALSNSEEFLGCPRNCISEEADPFGDDLYVDIDQASEMTCCSPECSSVLPSQHLAATGAIFSI